MCPATALAGPVKDHTACSASPADLAGFNWARSACCNAGMDIMEKAPVAGVRNVTRAVRHAGAHGPQTASLAISSSFSYAPRDSVTAPVPSTTMQTDIHRHVRGATQLVTSAAVRICLGYAYENGNLKSFSFYFASLSLFPPGGTPPFPKLFLKPLQCTVYPLASTTSLVPFGLPVI